MVVNLVALAALLLILSLLSDRFLSAENAANVFRQIATVVTVGCFFTILMVSGGIDLSVGGVLTLSGIVAVILVNSGVPIPLAVVVATLLGAMVGIVNGFLVAVVGLNTVIATLGTMYVTRGSALVLGGGTSIRAEDPGYAWLGNGSIGPVPMLAIVMLVVLVVTFALERRGLLGRFAVLVGTNPRGARLAGIPVRTVQLVMFALTGAAAGWAGVMVSSRLNTALVTAGNGFEFEVIIATLLGGTSLLGGEGSVLGMLVGALIVGCATSGMNILGVPVFIQSVLLGSVLITAVGLDAILRRRRDRPTRRVASAEA
jgi:ribose/xylose/arabinose/galactoside ABC-type transport system permease subunit